MYWIVAASGFPADTRFGIRKNQLVAAPRQFVRGAPEVLSERAALVEIPGVGVAFIGIGIGTSRTPAVLSQAQLVAMRLPADCDRVTAANDFPQRVSPILTVERLGFGPSRIMVRSARPDVVEVARTAVHRDRVAIPSR